MTPGCSAVAAGAFDGSVEAPVDPVEAAADGIEVMGQL